MKSTKIFLILLILVLVTGTTFACSITNRVSGITCNPCDSVTKVCECNFTQNINMQAAQKLFSADATSCANYTINVNTNGKNIWTIENFDMNTSFPIWNLIVTGDSKIYIDNYKTLSFSLSNIIVMEGAKLRIRTIDEQLRNNISITFKARDIEVRPQAELNINLKTNDGADGRKGNETDFWCSHSHEWVLPKPGESSGDLDLNINSIINYGKIVVDLETGKGGNGGKAIDNDITCLDAIVGSDYRQHGAEGGSAGDISLDIKNIINYVNFSVIVNTGDGGNGSHTSIDVDYAEDWTGGSGGNSGYINFKSIELIKNQGNFNLNAVAGNGGNAGTKRGNAGTIRGTHGNGGNGGSISDLNIDVIQNNSLDFKINLQSGGWGGISFLDNSHGTQNYYGIPGLASNIDINFLENTQPAIELISLLSFTNEQFQLTGNTHGSDGKKYTVKSVTDLGIKVTNINIHNLKNGSYLPKSINIRSEPEHPIFDNSINISGCYVQPSQVTYNLNGGLHLYATNIDSLRPFLSAGTSTTHKYCPHCEIIDLTDEINRYTRKYNIYTNISGKINPGDLQIFYSNPTTNEIYYTKRVDNTEKPVYINKEEITSTLNEKIGMREYKLENNKLVWFGSSVDEDREDLAEDEYLFCYGQEYIIKGKITIGTDNVKRFEFPFVPLRELFNN